MLALALLGAACGSGDISGRDAPGSSRNNPGGVDNPRGNGNSPTGDRSDPASNGAIGGSTTGNGNGNGTGSADDDDSPLGGGRGGGNGSSSRGVVREDLIGDAGSLSTATSISNDARIFTLPRAAVAVGQQLAFVATDELIGARDREEVGARSAIFLQRDDGRTPRALFTSADLVSPIDIDVSLDLRTLFVADFAGGKGGLGAIVVAPVQGGSVSFAAEGFSPRSVTVGPEGEVFFSGIDPASGQPGVFVLEGGNVRSLFVGAPLVDPSGIAVFADGRVLVADSRAFDAAGDPLANEASIVLIEDGQASRFASGFATGFPAGIALSRDEATLLVSSESADRHDTLLLIDVADPAAAPSAVTASFSELQDAAGGLKRAHDKDEFSFVSLAANGGGTVFRIE
ncbi:MAG TPA: hypothetical protein VMG12_26655 [Polyangiaceae bacterium]|nr:hypothetical protein [Polyangiaceae bacterium]